MRGGFLNVTQRHAGVEGGSNEGVVQRVRSDRLGDPGPAGHSPDDPGGPMTVKALAARPGEDRSLGPFADG